MDNREKELVKMLKSVTLDDKARMYISQTTLASNLEDITRILTAALKRQSKKIALSPEALLELRQIYWSWRKFYLENYYSRLFRRVDANYFEPDMQKQFKFHSYETYWEDMWKKNSTRAEAKRRQAGGRTIGDEQNSENIFTDDIENFSSVFGDNNELLDEENAPKLTGLMAYFQPILDEEQLLFGRFAENRVTILFGLEIIKLYTLVYPENLPKVDPVPKSQTGWLTAFVNEAFTPAIVTGNGELSQGGILRSKWNRYLSGVLTLWKSRKDPPSIAEIFEVTHMYSYVETILSQLAPLENEERLWKEDLPVAIPTELTPEMKPPYDFEKILIRFSKKMNNATMVSDEIENILVALCTVNGLKECFITSEICSDNPRHISNRPRIRANMDENYSKALRRYQNNMYKDVREREMLALHIDWSLILDRDIRFRNTFLLICLHLFIMENYQMPYFFYRYFVWLEAFTMYPTEVNEYCEKFPMLMQKQTFNYHFKWKDKVYYCENFGNFLYMYLVILVDECGGKLPLESSVNTTTPWYFITKKNLPYHAPEAHEAFRSEYDISNILDKFQAIHEEMEKEERDRDVIQQRTEIDAMIEAGKGLTNEIISKVSDLSFKETLEELHAFFVE